MVRIDAVVEDFLTVVPALAALAFPFVRQEVFDDHVDPHHATRLRRTDRRIDRRSQHEEAGFCVVASDSLWQRAGVVVKVPVLTD